LLPWCFASIVVCFHGVLLPWWFASILFCFHGVLLPWWVLDFRVGPDGLPSGVAQPLHFRHLPLPACRLAVGELDPARDRSWFDRPPLDSKSKVRT
jgi:hypothetical protein